MSRLLQHDLFKLCMAALAMWCVMNLPSLLPLFEHGWVSVRTFDPDGWLRLHIVSHLAETGNWFDHMVYRDNAPYGIVTPWTRPLDILLLMIAAPFMLVFSMYHALLAAAILLNPLLLMVMLYLLWPLVKGALPRASGILFLALASMTAPVPQLYWAFGFTDHHSLLITLYAALLFFTYWLTERGEDHAAWGAGIVIGLGIWTTIEFQLPAMVYFSWCGIWWVGMGEKRWLKHALKGGTGAWITVSVGLFLERGISHVSDIIYDSISLVHWSSLAAGMVSLGMLYILTPYLSRVYGRVIMSVIILALAGAILLHAFPLIPYGPMAEVSPRMKEVFLDVVFEMQPIYKGGWDTTIAAFFMAAIGCIGLFLHWRREGRIAPLNGLLILLTSSFAVLILLASRQIIYLYLPAILLAARGMGMFTTRPVSPAVICAVALAPYLINMAGSYLHVPTAIEKERAARKICYNALQERTFEGAFVKELGDAPLTLLAPQNMGPFLLFHTPYSIVSSNYHRNAAGYLDQYDVEGWRDAEKAKAILARRKVDVIILCRGSEADNNMPLLRLATEHTPAWLTPVPELTDAEERLFVFRVEGEKLEE